MDFIERHNRVLLFSLLLLTALFGFFALDRSPTIWFDEAAYIEPAWRLATTGKLRSLSQFDGGELGMTFLGQVPMYFFFQAGVIKLVGLSPWTMRGSAILFHVVAAALLWRMLYRRFRLLPAIFGMALLLFHPAVIGAIRSGRMDALALVLGCSGLAALDRMAEKDNRWWGAFGGLLMALAMLTHPASSTMVPVGVWLSRSDRIPSSSRWAGNLTTVAAVGMLALVPWLLYVTWVEPLAFRMQLGVAAEVMQQNSVSRFAVWSSRTRDLLGGFRLFVLGAAVVPVAFVIVASSRQSRSLLLAGLGAVCLQVFIVRGVIDGQTHLVVTFAFLLAAAVGVLEAKAHHLPSLRRWLAVLGVLFLLNGLTVPGARAYVACRQWSSRSPTEFARQWANVIPSNATVAGPAYSFYAAIQHNGSFRSIIPLFPGKDPRFLTYTRALCRAKLDYAVFPAGLQPSRYLSEDCAPYYQPVAKIRMPKAPIPGLAVESFDSDVYRRVEPQPAPFKPRTAASVSHVPDE